MAVSAIVETAQFLCQNRQAQERRDTYTKGVGRLPTPRALEHRSTALLQALFQHHQRRAVPRGFEMDLYRANGHSLRSSAQHHLPYTGSLQKFSRAAIALTLTLFPPVPLVTNTQYHSDVAPAAHPSSLPVQTAPQA